MQWPNKQKNSENTTVKPSNKRYNVLLLTDSHGRNLASILQENYDDIQAMGIVKPGAGTKSVTDVDLQGKMNEENEYVVCTAGANDIARNEARNCLESLENFLEANKSRNTIITTLPHRYDLIYNSCVNKEIRKTNIKMKQMCARFGKCKILDIGKLNRNLHTRHGMHLNYEGKKFLCEKICEIIKEKDELNRILSHKVDKDVFLGKNIIN